ncbi:hypothetical protein FHL15_006670 [Xylaria flabelliformis]|uniref:Uncharacterized protein n=1 Tax=Xylaria flabelliformis TaxID=2512241 RepID=A0A553HX30_9PEZI|nr:hypothetical protein FHL15_006670 [Xylaria flabelliformis]
MDEIQKKSQPASTTMAPTEFLFYPRLPTELKIMVWKYAFAKWSSGAHRFRLLVNPQFPTSLVLRPDNDQKEDASAWRERLSLAKIDSCSEYVFNKLQHEATQRNQLKLLYKDTSYSRRRRVEENGVAANICADTDLVTFRFNYGATEASLAILSRVENKKVFSGITQVGIEVELFRKGYISKKYKPFKFRCRDHYNYHPPRACPYEIVNFLTWFEDLEVVYIIFALKYEAQHASSNLLSDRAAVQPHLRASGTRVNQHTLETFQALQGKRPCWEQLRLNFAYEFHVEIARRRGLKQFHNRNGTYCAVTGSMLKHAAKLELIGYRNLIHYEWMSSHVVKQSGLGNWQSVQFRLLSWTNMRDATVIGDERPLWRAKPW